jgi:hypothetical protein
MPISRNKQLAMYALLSTRSAYRARLEGVPLLGSPNPPAPPQTKKQMLDRFATLPLPAGITRADMNKLIAGQLGDLFKKSAANTGNISADPEAIAFALQLDYDPTDPDCPDPTEGDIIAGLIVNNIPARRHKKRAAKRRK